MSFFGRAIAGAIGGALVGGVGTGSWSGAGIGAAFGAGTAGFGGLLGARMTAGRKGNLARGMAQGLGMLGTARGIRGTAIDRSLTRAAAFMGRNQIAINRYGKQALLGMATASSAYIGSSLLSSNRGY